MATPMHLHHHHHHLLLQVNGLRLLLLSFFFHFLCSQGTASAGETVRYLPGFEGPLPFHLETGYVGVDESNDVQLFYYFVKSERNPKEDPLVFWLTGGPRCSSFSAFAFEIGPVYFKIEEYDGSLPTLILNPNSWTKVANIVFLDQPVGSGFSYSRTEQGLHTTDTKSAMDTLTVITKWLIDHPEFQLNQLYICGDSYSGKIIPFLVQEIIKGIEVGQTPLINFAGYLIGNAVTDARFEQNAEIPFAHGKGFISDELYESLKQTCKGDYTNFGPKTAECTKDLDEFTKCVSGINTLQVLEPLCSISPPAPEQTSIRRLQSLSNETNGIDPLLCREYGYLLSYYWANNARVQEALHIRKGTVKEWIRCNYYQPYQFDIESSIEHHRNLSKKGYRFLLYSGDHDMWVSHISTEAWIRLLNLSIVDDWHPWLVDGQVAGYTRKFSSGMTYATVKGGGHTAPEYKPKECFACLRGGYLTILCDKFESWSHNQFDSPSITNQNCIAIIFILLDQMYCSA